MSKAAAIHTAICIQLASEGKSIPGWTEILGPTVNPAQAGRYEKSTIRGFLANVASRLRADTPPLAFNWSAIDSDKCLTDPLWVVEQVIAGVTTAIPAPASPTSDAKEQKTP
jgi:hypothetical protein